MIDEDLRGFDDAKLTLSPGMLLHHGTSSALLPSIEQDGMHAGSCWGTERVARYFARRNCEEHGGVPAILSVPMDRLDAALLSTDEQMIDFPIFQDYDERQYEWEEKSEQGWAECLRLYESVVYEATVAWRDLRSDQTLPTHHPYRRTS